MSTDQDHFYLEHNERFDPVEAEQPFQYKESFRVTAELMIWLYKHLDEIIKKGSNQQQLFSNLGVDMAHITAAVHNTRDRRDTGNIRGELLDYIICISHGCATNATTIYQQENGEIHSYGCGEYDAESADYILICRQHEARLGGHGCKWFCISKGQLKRLLDKHEGLIRH
jgi:hypothetical protein